MNNYAKACTLIDALAQTLTVPNLKLDEESNSCLLLFENDIVLNIEYDDLAARLILSIYLGELPSQGAEPLLRELMGANLYWYRTSGATLCLEEDTNAVMLVYGHSVEALQSDIFENIIENLVNKARDWQKHIERALIVAANATEDKTDQNTQPLNRTDGFIYG
jgi:hypothetical protein